MPVTAKKAGHVHRHADRRQRPSGCVRAGAQLRVHGAEGRQGSGRQREGLARRVPDDRAAGRSARDGRRQPARLQPDQPVRHQRQHERGPARLGESDAGHVEGERRQRPLLPAGPGRLLRADPCHAPRHGQLQHVQGHRHRDAERHADARQTPSPRTSRSRTPESSRRRTSSTRGRPRRRRTTGSRRRTRRARSRSRSATTSRSTSSRRSAAS